METKQVKAKLKELNDYFRDKIVAGEYEVTERDTHGQKIKIDGEFVFCLWVCNGSDFLETYGTQNTININFRSSDRLKAWTIIKKDRAETVDKEKDEKEKAEFERLKAKFGE